MRASASAVRLAGVAAIALSAGCTGPSSPTGSTPGGSNPTNNEGPPAVFVGAGDIGLCGSPWPSRTAALLDGIDGTVFTAGDNAYDSGTADEYLRCYDPTWGRHRARTRPTPGNHEYVSFGATPYYNYFGSAAGPSGLGYYSFDLGAWHVISLNSNVDADPSSPQVQWLKDDLRVSPTTCTLAYWHHPVFSTGEHGDDPKMLHIFRVLYESHADVVVTGHDHDYERFAPQTPDGFRDMTFGIREFVVGTGGHSDLRPFRFTSANSEARNRSTWGVLKLTLRSASYDWEFIPAAGGTFRDSGTGACVK